MFRMLSCLAVTTLHTACMLHTHPRLPPQVTSAPSHAEVPEWVFSHNNSEGNICGWGVAGPSFDPSSPYPKQLSKERGLRNLAGTFATQVQEAMIDHMSSQNHDRIETARYMHVDPHFIEALEPLTETIHWTDQEGQGPFQQKLFTYAHVCLKKKSTKTLDNTLVSSRTAQPPLWVTSPPSHKDGRLCAMGYAEPAFFAEEAFETVVQDIRGQLLDVITTFVSHYYEELTHNNEEMIQNITLSSTQAVSKGVVVVDYWYDTKGFGPYQKTHATYGYGCIYPMDAVNTVLEHVQYEAEPAEPHVIEAVRERAQNMFENLEQEEHAHTP